MTDFAQSNLFLASRWRRLLATGIDAILVPGITIFLMMLFDVVEQADDFVDRWWAVQVLAIAIGTYLALNGYTLWQSGQTLGKKILGIAIIIQQPQPNGEYAFLPAPFWKLIAIRALFFPLLFVGIIPFLVWVPVLDLISILGKRRRCLHDYFCGTLVVKLN
jgi:uncharacterized RDD family membrane protein YckC